MFCNHVIILVNWNSNDTGSFQKPVRGASSSVFIRGFDKNLEEDKVNFFDLIIAILLILHLSCRYV